MQVLHNFLQQLLITMSNHTVYRLHYKIFRQLLHQVRHEMNLTQDELAKLLGKPQSYVSRYETGEKRLDIIEFKIICSALGISDIDFLKRLDRKISNSQLD